MSQTSPRIAVIGAGMAGLTCAGGLAEAGVDVVVFEKSRGSGGRMSSRRSDGVSFDIGAQYFTARDDAFRDQVRRWSQLGWVERWDARIGAIDGALTPTSGTTDRFVGVPRMSALTRNVARDLDVRFGARVAAVVESPGDGWTVRLEDEDEQRGFDAVVCTAPAPQTAALIRDAAPSLAARIQEIAYSPTWAVSLNFDERVPTSYDAIFVEHGPLDWVARDGSKPGRDDETWVLHAGGDWAFEQLESEPKAIVELLTAEFAALSKEHFHAALPKPSHAEAHRWRYARLVDEQPFDRGAAPRGLHVAGDWVAGTSRVEAAWQSGRSTALAILADLYGPRVDHYNRGNRDDL